MTRGDKRREENSGRLVCSGSWPWWDCPSAGADSELGEPRQCSGSASGDLSQSAPAPTSALTVEMKWQRLQNTASWPCIVSLSSVPGGGRWEAIGRGSAYVPWPETWQSLTLSPLPPPLVAWHVGPISMIQDVLTWSLGPWDSSLTPFFWGGDHLFSVDRICHWN